MEKKLPPPAYDWVPSEFVFKTAVPYISGAKAPEDVAGKGNDADKPVESMEEAFSVATIDPVRLKTRS